VIGRERQNSNFQAANDAAEYQLVENTALYDPDTDFDRRFTLATAQAIGTWVRAGDRVLELGAATGLMTAELCAMGARVTAVDRDAAYLQRLRERDLAGVDVLEADLNETVPGDGGYRHVVATCVLHHLDDPLRFLRHAGAQLGPSGLLHLSMPNPRSLHRLLALEMGAIASTHVLSERDRTFGVRHVFDVADIAPLARGAGLRLVHHEGLVAKPLTNGQLSELPVEVLDGLEGLARHIPELCAINAFILRRD
jgi:2-polyprenyl-3-methyl-5-hydroxy-6-metoxy-1,4-benzoquinol methylase